MTLDVITIVSAGTPRAWVNECRRSIAQARTYCADWVNAIETPGVPGHIGAAMLGGLARGSADYVCFVDDDDFVLPNAFTCLERHFAAQPTAICAREIQWLATGSLLPVDRRHHLTAFRRDIIDTVDLMKFPGHPNVALQNAASNGAVDEMSWVYVWRRRRSPAMALRANITAADREALQ